MKNNLIRKGVLHAPTHGVASYAPTIATLALALIFIFGCSEKDKCGKFDPETQFCDERNGKIYKFVVIGEQTWMAKNLNYDSGNSKCYREVAENCEKFGSLYTWETAKNICPSGWHLPTDYEWAELALFAAPRAGAKLKTKEGWNFKNWNKEEFAGGGTDELGFSALPGGYAYSNGNFCNAGEESAEPCNYSKGAYWWSATEYGDNFSGVKYILHDAHEITQITGSKMDWRSVRCLKGDSAVAKPQAEEAKIECPEHDSKTHFCDIRDGKVYKQITIGKDIWMAENLNYAKGGECYGGKQENCDKYGRLYGHDMARGICPENWHLATDGEWGALSGKIGDSKKLKATDGWNGALGGYGNKKGGFEDIGDFGGWWCTQTYSYDYHTFGYYIQNKSNSINHGNPYGNESGYCDSGDECKLATLSVRCVKNTKCGDGYADPSNEQECCANKTVYDGFGQFCHKGKVYNKCGEVGGGDEYDPDTEFCFVWEDAGGSDAFTPQKCGGKEYNLKKQFCHNEKIYERCLNGEITGVDMEAGVYDPDLKTCKKGELEFNYGKLNYEGKTYKTIKIGNQMWMAENLNFEAEGSLCYDNKPENCKKYGRLYNWETAMTICPNGWHLPDTTEWNTLVNYVGGNATAGKKLRATSGWNENGNGEDKFGFAALPGGKGSFNSIGDHGFWWSANDYNAGYAYYQIMYRGNENASLEYYTKVNLYSVRCIKDN